jgi:tripartite-type tricarboxylate transporter receptor subunit TctC
MTLKKILIAALLTTPLLGLAQNYPTKPVRIMVGANAGGGTDIIARMLAEKLGEAFKGSFVVDNKPGASNTIAADLTAKAPPTATPCWWPPTPARPSHPT